MKQIDLHVHSTYSDGTLTPEQLVAHAIEMGLSAIALTDHDTVNGIAPALTAGQEMGLEVIPGVELSTFYNNKEIHIVGLYINYTDEAFKIELENQRDGRNARNVKICKAFQELGINIEYEDMKQKYGDIVITRAHFADYLLEKGFIKSRNEAFERYIGDNGPCNIPREKMDPANAIRLIRSVGGVPILAHPVLYHLGNEQMNLLMDHLCEAGLAGLEAMYSTYCMGEEIQMRNLASARNLIISGGSDYHGANKPNIELGTGRGHLFIPYEVLENIKAARDAISL